MDGNQLTPTGRPIGVEAARAVETPGQHVILTLDRALQPTGGLAVLRGNLAPDGCVVKLAGRERLYHRGTARVFDSEEAAMAAVTARQIREGDVVAVRYEGPRGGPGIREMLGITARAERLWLALAVARLRRVRVGGGRRRWPQRMPARSVRWRLGCGRRGGAP